MTACSVHEPDRRDKAGLDGMPIFRQNMRQTNKASGLVFG
jgi:hypothetical protein